eukprot:250130-Chlamydomonas_euryale.AAC.1
MPLPPRGARLCPWQHPVRPPPRRCESWSGGHGPAGAGRRACTPVFLFSPRAWSIPNFVRRVCMLADRAGLESLSTHLPPSSRCCCQGSLTSQSNISPKQTYVYTHATSASTHTLMRPQCQWTNTTTFRTV